MVEHICPQRGIISAAHENAVGRRLAYRLATGLFGLNLIRFHPEAFSGIVSIFWLDAVFFTAAAMIVLIGSVEKRRIPMVWVVLTLSLFVLALAPVVGIEPEGKITYTARIFYSVIVLPILFRAWFHARTDFVVLYAKLLVVSSVPIGLVVVFQFWDFVPLSEWVRWLWGSEKLRSISSSSPRVYGTFFNANWFGVYSVILGVSSWFLLEKHKIGRVAGLIFSSVLYICFGIENSVDWNCFGNWVSAYYSLFAKKFFGFFSCSHFGD